MNFSVLRRSILGISMLISPVGASGRELHFEPNRGQADPEVRFVARGDGYSLLLTPTDVAFRFPEGSGLVRMRIEGGNRGAFLDGEEPLTGRSNYFLGNSPDRWAQSVPHFARVSGRGVYPGVDLVYYGSEGELEFDFIISPGTDPGVVQLGFEGADVEMSPNGDLLLGSELRTLRVKKPLAYQTLGAERRTIPAEFVPKGENRVGIHIGAYDKSRRLIVDPVISYSTFLGGSSDDYARAVAVDAQGSAYVTGSTPSIDFIGASGSPGGGGEAFVVKLAPDGQSILYSTYLGGNEDDLGRGIAVDEAGYVYVTGQTWSSDFPTRNAFQGNLEGSSDAFVVKLSPTGSVLVYSTYLGGSNYDAARGAAVDADGNLVTMGQTVSPDFPTKNALQAAAGGFVDAFVTKLDASGGGLVFSTFLGGSGHDLPFYFQGAPGACGGPTDAPGWAIALDPAGFIHVAGTTESTNFPTFNALQSAHGGGLRDAFVTKLTPDGSAYVYSTYIGGTGGDTGRGLAVDVLGNAYVTGGTRSEDFPVTAGAIQRTKAADYDAFLLKIDRGGGRILYSTYIGGNGGDAGNAVAVDSYGSASFVGHTVSTDFPTLNGLVSGTPLHENLFLTKLSSAGTLAYSGYLAGNGHETPCGINMGIAVDAAGSAYVAAATESDDFPITSGAAQPTRRGGFDGFVTKVRTEPEIRMTLLEDGAGARLSLTLSNPGSTTREVEMKFWIDSKTLTEFPVSLVPIPLVLPVAPMPPTTIVDTVLPAQVSFPGTTLGVKLIDRATGLVLSESACSDLPCN